MDPLYNPLRTRAIQMGREMSIKMYPHWQFGLIDDPDGQSGSSLVLTWTKTQSDSPELLLTLHVCYTLRMGCRFTLAIYTIPGDLYAFLRPSATFHHSAIAINQMPHFPMYVKRWDVVTYFNTVFASDTLLAVGFASALSYVTGLRYTVQCSQSLVLCPQSSTLWVDPSWACDA